MRVAGHYGENHRGAQLASLLLSDVVTQLNEPRAGGTFVNVIVPLHSVSPSILMHITDTNKPQNLSHIFNFC